MALRKTMDEIFRKDADLTALRAIQEQKRQAAFYHQHPPQAVDGIGPLSLSVHPVAWASWCQALGPDIWHDPDFREWYRNHPDNEDCRVPLSGTGKIQVQNNWPAEERSGVRFKKVYA